MYGWEHHLWSPERTPIGQRGYQMASEYLSDSLAVVCLGGLEVVAQFPEFLHIPLWMTERWNVYSHIQCGLSGWNQILPQLWHPKYG